MKPFNPKRTYCNDGSSGPTNGCCYHHDRGYSNPGGRSRKEIDQEFLRCMKAKGLGTKGWVMYVVLRIGGWYRWNQCRANDRKL